MLRNYLWSMAVAALTVGASSAQEPMEIPVQAPDGFVGMTNIGDKAGEPDAKPVDAKPGDAKGAALPNHGVIEHYDWAGPHGPGCADCAPRRSWRVETGATLYYLQPNWENNPSHYVGTNIVGGVPNNQRNVEFQWDERASFAVYLTALNDSGFGFRARFWDFNNEQSGWNVVVPPATNIGSANPLGLKLENNVAGTNIRTDSRLDFYTIELEGVRVWRNGCWEAQGAAGLRYVKLDQDYLFFIDAANLLASTHSFQGLGPTFFLEGRYHVNNHLSLFANTRFSALFGDEDQSAVLATAGNPTRVRVNESDGVLSIGEIEVGAKFEGQWGHVRPFIEVAGVGQVWWGAGNASNSRLADPGDGGLDNSNMGLFGGRASVGIRY